MKPVEILKQARELISKPENWTTGEFARDYFDCPAYYDDASAVKFCSLGAIYKVEGISANCTKAMSLFKETLACSISHFNDTHMHAEVLEAFDKAISGLEKETSDGT